MLSDLEKEKIKLEEIYRKEVKESLEKKGSKKSFLTSVAAFFNSSFTLWLLSAVFITYGLKLYDDYKSEKEDVKNTEEVTSKLDLEIGYRYSQVLVRLYELSIDTLPKTKLSDSKKVAEIKKAALSISKSKNDKNIFLYTEYSNWSLLALLAEEKRLLSHLNKNTDWIYRVIGHISGLEVFYEVRKVDFTDARKVAGCIQKELWLEDWKYGGFYFSEGNSEDPFP
jgi:hypothetical protein